MTFSCITSYIGVIPNNERVYTTQRSAPRETYFLYQVNFECKFDFASCRDTEIGHFEESI